MTKHQIEIIKFFLKPIWLPLAFVGKILKDTCSALIKDMRGDDACDAWGAFGVVGFIGIVMLLFPWFMIGFWPVIIFLMMIVVGYFLLFYYRDHKKRVKKNGTD